MASTVLYMAAGVLDELERVRVLEGERGVTHLRDRVSRPRGA